MAGMVLCAVSFPCNPMLRSFHLLVVSAIAFGLEEALVTSSAAALVADLCQERHLGAAMGTFWTIFDIGHASGPIPAGILIARWDYGRAFLVVSAMVLLSTPVFVAGVKSERRDGVQHANLVNAVL